MENVEPTTFRMDAPDGQAVACYRWDAPGAPHAVVVIAHGMGEHARRYGRLARALGEAGYAVYALDHRGHGATAGNPRRYGMLGPGGFPAVVADYARLVDRARAEHPGLPVVALGHSFGSSVVATYLLDHAADVRAGVLSGASAMDQLLQLADPDVPMDLTVLNLPFEPARTPFDWLSRDEDEVDRYVADPACGFGIDADGVHSWIAAAQRMASVAEIAAAPEGFPVYLVAGSEDPVNAGLVLLDLVADRYTQAGCRVTKAYYTGARHEVFNETNRDEITANLVAWLNDVTG